jgi:hypothetical protein
MREPRRDVADPVAVAVEDEQGESPAGGLERPSLRSKGQFRARRALEVVVELLYETRSCYPDDKRSRDHERDRQQRAQED